MRYPFFLKLATVTVCCFSFLTFTLHSQDDYAVVEKYQNLSGTIEIHAIAVDANNAKWLGTNQGLIKLVGIKSTPEIIKTDTTVAALAADNSESIWSGLMNKDILDAGQKISHQLTEEGVEISSMAFYRGMLYIGTNKGLYTFNPRTSRASKYYTKENSRLPNNNINMLFADPYEQLWIGTDEGIVQMTKNRWRVMERDHQFQAATHTKEGIWLVSDKEIWVVNMKESSSGRWYPADVNRGLSKGKVRALASDSKGRIYLASEIVVQFDPYSNKAEVFDQDYGFVSSQALALICDKNDDLWVGTGDQGLFRIDILEGEVEELAAVAYVSEELKCNGRENGEVKLKVNGGKKPYSIKWNVGAREKETLQGLAAGTYTATITDADGRSYVASTELAQPDPIIVTELINERVSAYRMRDGKLKVGVDGGTKPYSLRWNNGRRGVLEHDDLKYGEYTLTVTDANRCEHEATFKIDKPKVLPQLDIARIEIGQTLRIEELFFEADSALVAEDSYAVLDEIYEFLSANTNVIVEIGGHTNSIPPHEYCDKLSTARAQNVAEYLYSQGASTDQIVYKGYGKRKLIDRGTSRKAHDRNQRVEIKILNILEK